MNYEDYDMAPLLEGVDYTLSGIKFVKLSFPACNRLVVEPSPYSDKASLGAWLRIYLFNNILFTVFPVISWNRNIISNTV